MTSEIPTMATDSLLYSLYLALRSVLVTADLHGANGYLHDGCGFMLLQNI